MHTNKLMDACNTSLHQRKTMEISQSCHPTLCYKLYLKNNKRMTNNCCSKLSHLSEASSYTMHCTLQWWIHVRSFIMHQKLEQYQLVKSIYYLLMIWYGFMHKYKSGKIARVYHMEDIISQLWFHAYIWENWSNYCAIFLVCNIHVYNVFSLLEETQQPTWKVVEFF
jgi:hypothetical protein